MELNTLKYRTSELTWKLQIIEIFNKINKPLMFYRVKIFAESRKLQHNK